MMFHSEIGFHRISWRLSDAFEPNKSLGTLRILLTHKKTGHCLIRNPVESVPAYLKSFARRQENSSFVICHFSLAICHWQIWKMENLK